MLTQFFVYYLLLDVVICRCAWLDEGYSKATAANHMEGSQLRLDSILASCLHRQKSMAPSPAEELLHEVFRLVHDTDTKVSYFQGHE